MGAPGAAGVIAPDHVLAEPDESGVDDFLSPSGRAPWRT